MPTNSRLPPSPFKNRTQDLPHGTTNKRGIELPTGAKYAGLAARDFLDILKDLAQAVPVPSFSAAVNMAVYIINACDESQATLTSAKKLKNQIQEIIVIFVDELKGKKKKEERSAGLIRDHSEIEYIKKKLDQITSQHPLRLFFFRSINNYKVNECIARLENAMEKFTLRRTIALLRSAESVQQSAERGP
ncbi:hypothetical protein C0995_010676 [Termitomyces sp. Mi166|nr:hypothetical protein C0995_010676 [Termitomyces sp. Mi166\